jgi:hypothetical protein
MFCSNPGVGNHQQTIPDSEMNNCSETFLAKESGRVRKRSSKCFAKPSLYKPFIIVQARSTTHYCRLRRPFIQQIYYFVSFPLSHIAAISSGTHWQYVVHVSLHQAGVMAGSATARFTVAMVGQAGGIGYGVVFPSQKF